MGTHELRADLSDLRDVTGLDQGVLRERLHQLERAGVAAVEYDEDGVPPYVDTRTVTEDFPLWWDIRKFCSDRGRDLEDVIVNLRFDLLD
ncbi:hypothetical protein [Prescottella equi]